MPAGWTVSEIPRNEKYYSDDELWSIINGLFSGRSRKTTTYKFCFLKAIIDNIFNVDGELRIGFEKLYERFTEVYWNLVVKYGLVQVVKSSQRRKSSVERIIEGFLEKYDLSRDTSYEALRDDLKDELCRQIGSECSKYVVGALCGDLRQVFYGFSKQSRLIFFNQSAYAFLAKYKRVIEKENYFEWIKFLEAVNERESAYAIAEKLDISSKRENLSFYRDFLLKNMKRNHCFYCGRSLSNTRIEVDHFIPWSFVKDNKVWNFVLSCRACNNKKRDILAADEFIQPLIERNRIIIARPELFTVVKEDLYGYDDDKLVEMYKSAQFNGFRTGWKPAVSI